MPAVPGWERKAQTYPSQPREQPGRPGVQNILSNAGDNLPAKATCQRILVSNNHRFVFRTLR